MKTLVAALLLCLALSPVSAQTDKPPKPAARPKRVLKALSADSPEVARRIFTVVDKTIHDLAESVHLARACVADGAYLKKDLAATIARLTPKGGEVIPSNQAALVVLKESRLSRQNAACAARSKNLVPLFDEANLTLSRTEPQSHPGIKTRKAEIAALRVQSNQIYLLLGGKALAGKTFPAETDADADPAP